MSNKQQKDDEPLQVVLEVTDKDTLVELLAAVDDAEKPIRTENITHPHMSPETEVTLDVGILTDKQRDALELALEQGYYERPRNASLSDLAEQLDISKSAVSQRIRSAEIKLIKGALGRYE